MGESWAWDTHISEEMIDQDLTNIEMIAYNVWKRAEYPFDDY